MTPPIARAARNNRASAEAAAGHCVKSSPPLANGKPQLAYDFPDGTSVRVKPRGDTKTTDPMYSIEVLQHPGQRAMNQDGVAVKLGRDGTAVPKGPRDVKNPYKQKTRPKQFEAYLGEVMRQGHLRTTEPPTESP